jgi:hypothetical protein
MQINQAVNRVLGERAATAIINDNGMHWAVVAAMAACTVGHGPEVRNTLKDYVTEMKTEEHRKKL